MSDDYLKDLSNPHLENEKVKSKEKTKEAKIETTDFTK